MGTSELGENATMAISFAGGALKFEPHSPNQGLHSC